MIYDTLERAGSSVKHIISMIKYEVYTGYWYKRAYACFRYKLIPVSGIRGPGGLYQFLRL